MKANFLYLLVFLFTISCSKKIEQTKKNNHKQYITVLGTAQDGGYPHIGCQRTCCANFYNGINKKKMW
ncbi:hypothetical protein [Polaribacter ponticola]|uniref:Lipoprotein n=1 Tax=Polaribacter ponticola TaxID=2978475 RepID=A0ABT5S9T2_9FLAO|nr:hypothetical protein [Polaribacter sp. MSW5]MDD7914871.1 hypothetical protein [Polaribacter sp. MSW5]